MSYVAKTRAILAAAGHRQGSRLWALADSRLTEGCAKSQTIIVRDPFLACCWAYQRDAFGAVSVLGRAECPGSHS